MMTTKSYPVVHPSKSNKHKKPTSPFRQMKERRSWRSQTPNADHAASGLPLNDDCTLGGTRQRLIDFLKPRNYSLRTFLSARCGVGSIHHAKRSLKLVYRIYDNASRGCPGASRLRPTSGAAGGALLCPLPDPGRHWLPVWIDAGSTPVSRRPSPSRRPVSREGTLCLHELLSVPPARSRQHAVEG